MNSLSSINSVPIHPNGYWESSDARGHAHDQSLQDELISFLQRNEATSVLDLGCGLGLYARAMAHHGFTCEAYDGNPNTEALTSGFAKTLDLAAPVFLGKMFDCVISLEVGEHIPAAYQDVFLDNVCRHAGRLICISWACEGQPGDGHVNCRNNDWVVEQLSRRGFLHQSEDSATLRGMSRLPWFRNTLMVFVRNIAI